MDLYRPYDEHWRILDTDYDNFMVVFDCIDSVHDDSHQDTLSEEDLLKNQVSLKQLSALLDAFKTQGEAQQAFYNFRTKVNAKFFESDG